MTTFTSFQEYLDESLNTPVEFYITDDTVIPSKIYATFILDDVNYGMSLLKSGKSKIYLLKVYQVINGKPRQWKFAKTSHVRPVMSTVLKFAEGVQPFLKGQIDGVVLEVSKKLASEKFNNLIRLMVNRLYQKTFKAVPISVDLEKMTNKKEYYHYVFFVRKGVNPKQLFKSAAFSKYVFHDDGALPIEAAQDIEPAVPEKSTVSMKPSKKYSLGKEEYELVSIMDSDFHATLESESQPKDGSEYEESVKGGFDPDEYAFSDAIPTLVPNAYDNIKKHGFDPDKVNKGDLKYIINHNVMNTPGLKNFLKSKNMDHTSEDFLDAVLDTLKMGIISDAMSKEFEKSIKNAKSVDNVKFVESNINASELPVADSLAVGRLMFDSEGGWTEINSEGDTIIKHHKEIHVLNKMGYDKNLSSMDSLKTKHIREYTSSMYSSYNTPLRNLVNRIAITGSIDDVDKFYIEEIKSLKILELNEIFNDIQPLPEPMWVYRGSHINDPESEVGVGKDFIQPSFMSTSLRPEFPRGWDGNVEMAIYLPKGSRIVPALSNTWSNHESEKEIILPPMSVCRSIKYAERDYGKTPISVAMVYQGNIFDSILDNLNESVSINDVIKRSVRVMTEAKKTKDSYDANDKYAGKYDSDVAKALKDLMKSGKASLNTKTKK